MKRRLYHSLYNTTELSLHVPDYKAIKFSCVTVLSAIYFTCVGKLFTTHLIWDTSSEFLYSNHLLTTMAMLTMAAHDWQSCKKRPHMYVWFIPL